MASEPDERPDPHLDGRADYDHADGRIARPDLAAALADRIEGDVTFDEYSRQLFATDASIYEVTPIGVVRPKTTEDVASVVSYCNEREIPVLPRGGGTSLAGQTVNEAVVLDFKRHMDEFLGVDPDAREASAQVGITLAELNAAVEPEGLKYAPDPAWGDKSVLGGCIGNNSTGAHSLKYEKADGYIESVTAVLADGTVTEFGWMDLAELDAAADPAGDLEARIYDEVRRVIEEESAAVRERYPDLKRNVSGYNLDVLVEDAETRGEVNLGRLLAGSEGTLAVVTEATVSLEPIPETTSVAMLAYDDVLDAMRDVAPILEHDPSAVEVMDDVFLDMARDTEEFAAVAGLLPEGTDSTLLVEFYADSEADARRKVADLIADRVPDERAAGGPSDGASDVTDADPVAVDVLEAYDDERQAKFWKMRKAGLPILLSNTGDDKHYPYIEDTAVPAEHLPEYVADFREILDDFDTFASYYAHAGPGVLHIRPLINLKTQDGVDTMEGIADRVTDLVMKYDGSISGEHGDGRARTQWNEKFYGRGLWETFRSLKRAFDPNWILNPGQVCGDEDGPTDMTEDLRFDPEYDFEVPFDPELDWNNENGFQGMTELCHGCAGCTGYQDTTGGVMCPTYRAADEEITSTRGRANALRQAMSGDLPDDPTDEAFVSEVLDLCIGCKGCKHDCPSGVDLAKLKAEVTHAHHQEHGVDLQDRLFANVDSLFALGSRVAPLANALSSLPGADWLLEKTVGIASERETPTLHGETVRDWAAARDPGVRESAADRSIVLFVDAYTNYTRPAVGRAAVEVLEATGTHVAVADTSDSGRPAYSLGMLDKARGIARENVARLEDHVDAGREIVFVEPSDAVMAQTDYLDLLGRDHEGAERIAAHSYGLCEYLDAHRLVGAADWDAEGSLTYHGHCHQKATAKDHHAVGALRRAGYEVDPLDSGCCGMAGSFGYEAEHYSMSRAIGEILYDQVEESDGDRVVAPGASCRTQLGDRPGGGEPLHPATALADALRSGSS
ncbi:FAD-binding and (Fe-S)-binding domain-containing protein [Halobellus sp. EA9]|uniref:FAD-binding and (Fe-S)-binding domain-containing protein n=1 Tax=Halobellus sp. EA9 TaxID=3421647 RepID=UPI003EB81B6F